MDRRPPGTGNESDEIYPRTQISAIQWEVVLSARHDTQRLTPHALPERVVDFKLDRIRTVRSEDEHGLGGEGIGENGVNNEICGL